MRKLLPKVVITFFGILLSLLATQLQASTTLRFAFLTGPSETVPDPRARQNGWMSNQAGVTETLMGLDYEMQLYPRVAQQIEQRSATVWRVTLRPGIRFHDGSRVTAQAVINGLNTITDPDHPGQNPRLASLMGLNAMEAVDDLTIDFHTQAPNAAFPWTLSEPGIAVLGPPSKAFPINATGPFIFREAVIDQLYRAESNPDYWGGTPQVDEIRVLKIADPATAALAFEAGEVDVVINYPETDYLRISTSPGIQGLAAPTTQLYFYALNVKDGPLSEPAIRQAVSLAIDREAIISAALSDVGGVPAGTLFPSMMPWSLDQPGQYDPDAARAKLREAGAVEQGGHWMWQGQPLTLTIRTYASRAALPVTAELTQAFLAQIGIQADVQIGEWTANNEALSRGEADMHLQAWGSAPQGDPSYLLETLLDSNSSSNLGGYHNPELDILIRAGRSELDSDRRHELYTKAQQIVADEVALIPVFHARQLTVARDSLHGFKVHPALTYWMHPDIRIED